MAAHLYQWQGSGPWGGGRRPVRALRLTVWQHEPALVEVDDPTPGPGAVVVRIGGAGACHSDLHLMHEFPPGVVPFDVPFTLGHENAGWVESVGAGVTGLEVGQPVAVYGAWGCGQCSRCLQGMENYCENRRGVHPRGLRARVRRRDGTTAARAEPRATSSRSPIWIQWTPRR